MIEPIDTVPALPVDPAPPHDGWQQLPVRGARLAAISGGLGMALVGALVAGVLMVVLRSEPWWLWLPGGAVPAAVLGAWTALRRHRRIWWQLDAHGLALRRGHWWRSETRVPISRVQHLDLRRGPLERKAGLSTLVVHTAGSRFSAVAIAGLDHDDAERLRDRLARQLDQDDDAL